MKVIDFLVVICSSMCTFVIEAIRKRVFVSFMFPALCCNCQIRIISSFYSSIKKLGTTFYWECKNLHLDIWFNFSVYQYIEHDSIASILPMHC